VVTLLPAWPEISRYVWETRYRYADEADLACTWKRVADAVASMETRDAASWRSRFRRLLDGFCFLPGGRILAGAGTGRQVTLFNCFVMGPVDDSIEGIFDALREGALTMQQGGGVGYDFSTLRPEGGAAQSSGTTASGPVSFMRIWDAMCATLLSTGARRGAMMGTLRCDHPDITAFIDAKRDSAALRHFNLSVQVSDAFISAVAAKVDWPLLFPSTSTHGNDAARSRRVGEVWQRLPAVDLWDRILRAAYDTGEPGVLFIDRINRENNMRHQEHITATNPCGEVPLPPYGACNLGSINLAAFVIDPFAPGARLDFDRITNCAREAVRFLDNVIDLSMFPLPRQERTVRRTRRIGLGVTGLGDALAMLGHRYESWTARGVAEDVMQQICLAAYDASVDLAAERGAYSDFDRDAFLGAPFISRLPDWLRDRIARHGIRNSHLLAVAPAGSISLLAGNLSSGIEPIFDTEMSRRVLGRGGQEHIFRVTDYAAALWDRLFPGEDRPATICTAHQLGVNAQLEMQACIQRWVDNAVSKTINLPAGTSFADFRSVFDQAYRLGLKGCTVFRSSDTRDAILRGASTSSTAGRPCCP
jgi:ribonucleoside-diphosphate reductase alpha chain